MSGVVADKPNGDLLPGAYIQVRGTSINTYSNTDGSFQISIPADTATLQVRFIGYKEVAVRVSIGENVQVRMRVQAHIDYFYQRYIGLAVSSAAPHTPLGGHLTLFQPYLLQTMSMQPAARVELEHRVGPTAQYQTATLALDELVAAYYWNVDAALDLQRLRLRQWQFERRSFGANVTYSRSRLPLWLAAGRVQLSTEHGQRSRNGLEIGSAYSLRLEHQQYFILTSRLAWWQTVWQWQHSVALDHRRYILEATYWQVGQQYAEVGLQLGMKLTVATSRKSKEE